MTQLNKQGVDNQGRDVLQVLARASRLYSEEQVNAAVSELAEKINQDYSGKTPLVLCVMNGGLVATAKIVSKLTVPLQMDYIHATRYGDETNGRELKWIAGPKSDLANRDILLMDDILDEGVTLQAILEFCNQQGAASVNAALLVRKLHNRCVSPNLGKYIGLTVPDRYVFGCGMDYKGYFRNLPEIYALDD